MNAPPLDLHFGLLAVRNGLLGEAQFLDGVRAWTHDPSLPLAEHLRRLGYLDEAQCAAVDALVVARARLYGSDSDLGLASLPIEPSLLSRLMELTAPEQTELLEPMVRRQRVEDPRPETAPGVPETLWLIDRPEAEEPTTIPAALEGRRFRVLRPHAEGGLGAVFVALDAELNREVALKQILPRHADDLASRQRFLLEAEVTGGLEHPGIVPVYALGADPEGRPYYAMRFIRGESLKEAISRFHADTSLRSDAAARSLALRKLLRRFQDVCDAIDYAHARGVLHRDIKPANIIVGRFGETLVVDWGLAKATGRSHPELDESALRPSSGSGSQNTQPGSVLGTPAYMSPEQASSDLDSMGPRSDVYSLGATLYCLLTGKPPFQGGDFRDICLRVASGDFPPPRRLDPSIDKALEAVCLKAMATETHDRYDSARSLAEDLDRWLADERVRAYREPLTRAMSRWVNRHRTAVSAAAAAGLVAIVALGGLSLVQTQAKDALELKNIALDLQRRRAEEREQQAINAVKRFADVVVENPELKHNPSLESLRQTLLKEPLRFFQELRQTLQLDRDTRPEALEQLAEAAHQLGSLTKEIGDQQNALKAHEEAQAIYERLVSDAPTVPQYQRGLAACLGNVGASLAATGRSSEALVAQERARRIQRELVLLDPTLADDQSNLAKSHLAVGRLLRVTGKSQEALAAYQEGDVIRRQLVEQYPANRRYRREFAQGLHDLAELHRELGKSDDSLRIHEQARTIFASLTQDTPDDAEVQSDLAACLHNIGSLMAATGQGKNALSAYEQARTCWMDLNHRYPSIINYQSDLTKCCYNLGNLYRDLGKFPEALAAFEQGRALLETLVERNPAVTEYRRDMATNLFNIGRVLQATGKPNEALAALEQALAIDQKLARDNPTVTQFQSDLALSNNNLGLLLRDLGKPAEALKRHEAARSIRERLVRENPTVPVFASDLARSHLNLANLFRTEGDPAKALDTLRSARTILARLVKDHPAFSDYQRDLASCLNNMSALLLEEGKLTEALATSEATRAIRARLAEAHPDVPEFRSMLAANQSNLGVILGDLHRPEEAMAAHEQARSIQEALTREHPEVPQYASSLGGTLNNMALLDLEARRYAEARDKLRQAITWQKKALAANPTNPGYRRFLANHLGNLERAAKGLGHDDEVADVRRELTALAASDPRFAALDARLSAVQSGAAPKDDAERLALAGRAYDTKRHALAARLWGEALTHDPGLAEDRQSQQAYNAACSAALAAAGQGADAPPDAATRAQLRAQALGWLRLELKLWNELLAHQPKPEIRAVVARTLQHWREDPDLAGIREAEAVDQLPKDEQAALRGFWSEADESLARLKTGDPGPGTPPKT